MASRSAPVDHNERGRLARQIATPEGVPITATLASRGERAIAFGIDLGIIFVSLAILWVLLILQGGIFDGFALAATLLVSFAVRSFYFAFFELRWRGATPGKRMLNLRVVDREGGPLVPAAVLGRNLMREVEVFLPLSFLLMPNQSGDQDWAVTLAFLWIGLFGLLPLFNRDNMRAGDLVAGTWVIVIPKQALLRDLATAHVQKSDAEEAYRFTQVQLEIYGVYELQVLEEVLRDAGPRSAANRQAVAESIQKKIGFQPPAGVAFEPVKFLESFYKAQRKRLESDIVVRGRRRKSKHDR